MTLSSLVLLIGAATQQAPVSVQPSPMQDSPVPSNEQRIVQASTIGRFLYVLDRAAWVSSDALMAKVPKDQLAGLGGYIVEPADGQDLRVTYYRGGAADARAFFRADVRDGKVVSSDLLETPIALTPAQVILAKAREAAARASVRLGYKPCTAAPFNTVVLPSTGSRPIAVYLLSAQTNAASYPMGGSLPHRCRSRRKGRYEPALQRLVSQLG